MRRADRLFQIVQLIRGRRLTTAQWLARRLEVSERTVYRDVADLQYQGVPIEGEAGVGYRLGEGFDLPPLIFTPQEAQALVVMTRVAQQWLDPALARASESALSRVLSVLPADQRHAAQHTGVFATVGSHGRAAAALATLARGHTGPVQAGAGLQRCASAQKRAHGLALGQFFLGRSLDAGGLVRKAPGIPKFSLGPHPVDDAIA